MFIKAYLKEYLLANCCRKRFWKPFAV